MNSVIFTKFQFVLPLKMTDQNIRINYRRLKRHYDLNLKGYDDIALYDLAHSLRMWVDMKEQVSIYLKTNQPDQRFKSYTVNKQLKRLLGRYEYVIACLPKGVTTWGGNPVIASGKKNLDLSRPFTKHFKIIRNANQSFTCIDFVFIDGYAVPKEQMKIIDKGFSIKHHDFKQWLGSETIRLAYKNQDGDLERRIISREIFIGRVANILGGSHPIGLHDSNNRFNDAVRYLMDIEIDGLPAPYLIILKIAKDILESINVPRND